ncbi:MAG: radical SAM protein, partial [Promethearchaeota archaeon]
FNLMKRFFFGPVLSRRLGFSLGIDILPDKKTCTFDCLYCEIGKTLRVISPKTRLPFFSEFKKNFELQLRKILAQDILIDTLTFAGYSGEATLNSELDSFLEITKLVKSDLKKDNIPITILTNSSTVNSAEIRKKLAKFDIIVAKLDIGNQASFKKVNKPHFLVPQISEIINGLKQLKKELTENKLIIQTLLFSENIDKQNIDSLIKAYNIILPDSIQLYSIARPPAYPVKRLDNLQLEEINKIIQRELKAKIEIETY